MDEPQGVVGGPLWGVDEPQGPEVVGAPPWGVDEPQGPGAGWRASAGGGRV